MARRDICALVLVALLGPGPAMAQVVCNAEALPEGAEGADVPAGSIRQARTTMGTNLQLGASGVTCEQASEAFAAVFAEFDRLERLTSSSHPDSEVRKINAMAGKEPVVVDKELFGIIQLALGFAEMSAGAFDPTFAAMDGVWKFESDKAGSGQVPDPTVIEQRRQKVSFQNVVLDPAQTTVMLKEEGMVLSLGGIAKGYATDNAVKILRAQGVPHFIIRSGGDMFIEGDPGGKGRRIGIPDPRGDRPFALVEVKGRAFNISRDADKSFVKDGVRYHHIIDPRTGYPAHVARTVAVMANDAATADALSTAIFVLGPGPGLELAERRRGVEAIIVDADNRVHMTSGFGPGLELYAPSDESP